MNKALEARIDKIISDFQDGMDMARKAIMELHGLKIDIEMCECKKKEKKHVRENRKVSTR